MIDRFSILLLHRNLLCAVLCWIGAALFSLLPWQTAAEEIVVRLKTSADLKPVYIARVKTEPNEFDWRYFEELRSVLVFDIDAGGFGSVPQVREEWEQTLRWPDVKKDFDLALWRREKIPFVLAASVQKKIAPDHRLQR